MSCLCFLFETIYTSDHFSSSHKAMTKAWHWLYNMYTDPSNVCDACTSDYASLCVCVSTWGHPADISVTNLCNCACCLAKLIVVVSLNEKKAAPLSSQGYWLYSTCFAPKPQEKAVGNGWGQQGRIRHPLQLGEMVRRRRQLHVRHLRMLMVMCMRGPKLKRRL